MACRKALGPLLAWAAGSLLLLSTVSVQLVDAGRGFVRMPPVNTHMAGKYLPVHTWPPSGGNLNTSPNATIWDDFTITVTIVDDALMVPPSYNGTQKPCPEPCPYKNILTATQADVDEWNSWWTWTPEWPLYPKHIPGNNSFACWDRDLDGDGHNDTAACYAQPKGSYLFCLASGGRNPTNGPKLSGKQWSWDGKELIYQWYNASFPEGVLFKGSYSSCNLKNITVVGPGKLKLRFWTTMEDEAYKTPPHTPLDAKVLLTNISALNVVSLIAGSPFHDMTANKYNTSYVGLRHHFGQILAPLKKDYYHGTEPWNHIYAPWFTINGRSAINGTTPPRGGGDHVRGHEAHGDGSFCTDVYWSDKSSMYPAGPQPWGNYSTPRTPPPFYNASRNIFDYQPTLANTTQKELSYTQTFSYNTTARELTWTLQVDNTGTKEFNHNVTDGLYHAIAIMVDGTWKLKHFWHPLRRWKLSFNDPVSAYPLRKVGDRIYHGYERTDPRVVPDCRQAHHPFAVGSPGTGGCLSEFGALFTEEVEDSENVQRLMKLGYFNSTNLISYTLNPNFTASDFLSNMNETWAYETMLEYAEFQSRRFVNSWGNIANTSGNCNYEGNDIGHGFRLIWDKNSELNPEGEGAWFRRYGFMQRGNMTYGYSNNTKPHQQCLGFMARSMQEYIAYPGMVHWYHFDKSISWDVYEVDTTYPTNNYASEALRVSGSPPRQTRVAVEFETIYQWWSTGFYFGPENMPYGPDMTTLNETKSYSLYYQYMNRWVVNSETKGKWYRGGDDYPGWGKRSNYTSGIEWKIDWYDNYYNICAQAGFPVEHAEPVGNVNFLSFLGSFSLNWVILSQEWFSPPFASSMSSYYILGPKTGMVGRQVGNYSFAPMYVDKGMNHRNCSGLQAIPDLDNHDPYEMYQNFMCADKFDLCWSNAPAYLRRRPEPYVPFSYTGTANYSIHGFTSGNSGLFGNTTRSRINVRDDVFNKTKYARDPMPSRPGRAVLSPFPFQKVPSYELASQSFDMPRALYQGWMPQRLFQIQTDKPDVYTNDRTRMHNKFNPVKNDSYNYWRDLYPTQLNYYKMLKAKNASSVYNATAANYIESFFEARTYYQDFWFNPYANNALPSEPVGGKSLPFLQIEHKVAIQWTVTMIMKNCSLSDVAPPFQKPAPYYA